jgi:hypothetical protein
MSVVYNICYEGTDIRRFVDTLRTVGIECLSVTSSQRAEVKRCPVPLMLKKYQWVL